MAVKLHGHARDIIHGHVKILTLPAISRVCSSNLSAAPRKASFTFTLSATLPMTRRNALGLAAAGSAVLLGPGAAGALPIREVDVAVVGAGAAGIAAGRALVRAGVSTLLVEASGRTGGRCLTDRTTFSAPFDRGAHWLHAAGVNPLVKLGRDLGLDVYIDPTPGVLVAGAQRADEDVLAAYRAAVNGAEDAMRRFAENRGEDVPASQALPRDLGEWRGPVRFKLGPLDCGKTLSEISLQDFVRAPNGEEAFCRTGLGALVSTLARGLPTALSSPVQAVAVENGSVRLDTAQGTLRARTAIVTVSTAVLEQGGIRFTPELDESHRNAIEGLKLGAYLHVGFEIPGNPLGLAADTLVNLKVDEERTFAALACASGTDVWYVDTGGIYARELEAAGPATAIEVAKEWLVAAFGADIRQRIQRALATQWGRQPTIGGSWSVASPGKAGGRGVLRQPHAERVFFAGEACHDTLWGTVGGAWESGEAAAREALRLVRG
jgi:monoamine oxidase